MPQKPTWFTNTINQNAEELRVGEKGKQLAVRYWPATYNHNAPAIIMIHGFLAHARWFDFIAPSLTDLGPVYAFDMPGMGDSDHFETYEMSDYIDCFRTVMDELGLTKPHIVSHSLGSLMAMNFAYLNPDQLSGLIITDSPFHLESKEPDTPRTMRGKYFETKQELLNRFRLLPDQECQQPYILDYIAEHSVKQTAEGWRWKFDWNRQTGTQDMYTLWETSFERFKNLQVPNAFIYGENSKLCTPEWISKASERLKPDYEFIGIKNAEHHLLLDQPLDFINEVKRLILSWS